MTVRAPSASLTRALAVVLSIAALLLAGLRYEPRIAALQRESNDTRQLLRSDEVEFASAGLLRSERAALLRELGARVTAQPEAAFVRDLAAIARRRRVRIVSTSFQRAPELGLARTSQATAPGMQQQRGSVGLEGSYANLLEAIADLSRGDALILVGTPSLRRSASGLVADVPVTLFEPARGTLP